MTIFVRGRSCREQKNPLNRMLIWIYPPVIDFVLRRRALTIGAAALILVLSGAATPVNRSGAKTSPLLDFRGPRRAERMLVPEMVAEHWKPGSDVPDF